jgi:hypothetical protein
MEGFTGWDPRWGPPVGFPRKGSPEVSPQWGPLEGDPLEVVPWTGSPGGSSLDGFPWWVSPGGNHLEGIRLIGSTGGVPSRESVEEDSGWGPLEVSPRGGALEAVS